MLTVGNCGGFLSVVYVLLTIRNCTPLSTLPIWPLYNLADRLCMCYTSPVFPLDSCHCIHCFTLYIKSGTNEYLVLWVFYFSSWKSGIALNLTSLALLSSLPQIHCLDTLVFDHSQSLAPWGLLFRSVVENGYGNELHKPCAVKIIAVDTVVTHWSLTIVNNLFPFDDVIMSHYYVHSFVLIWL